MSEKKQELFTIEKQTLQEVLNYLVERPYKETSGLIVRIQMGAKPFTETSTPVATVTPIKVENTPEATTNASTNS